MRNTHNEEGRYGGKIMKIVDWFKNLINKISKKDYMLEEGSKEQVTASKTNGQNTDWIQKVDVSNLKPQKTRDDVIKGLRDDIIVENLSEEYNYGKFSREKIEAQYDKDNLLTEEDKTAIQCLYGAIKDENHNTYPKCDENKIIKFLKENPNNIVTTVNLMIQNAKKEYQRADKEMIERYGITVNGLIPGSYTDISNLIENYREQEQAQGIE